MKAIARVLLATNLTPHSDRAMERAVQVSRQFGADLAVIYAIQPANGSSTSVYDRWSPAEIEMEVTRHLMSLPGAASLSPIVVAMQGPIEQAVSAYAALWEPDIVVVGAHRSDAIKDLFAVTTVEKITVATDKPLLVVRNKPFRPYASALVPINLLDMSRTSVAAALTLVPEGAIELLHVIDVPGTPSRPVTLPASDLEAEFAALLADLDLGHRVVGTSVRSGVAMEEIIAAAHAGLPDLIVMGTTGRTGIGRALIGSTAHEILEHLPSDVLLVRLR